MKPPLRGLFVAAVCFSAGLLAAPYGPVEPFVRVGAVLLPLLAFTLVSLLLKDHESAVIILFLTWFAVGWARGVPRALQPLPDGRAWIEGVAGLPVEREGAADALELQQLGTQVRIVKREAWTTFLT